ncbi:hypothetical protein A4A49_08696 [Nicotiana attenuata]|uniref:Retrotransposon gag domain-containing protein n=1 Tax=Nicotiana attenuata TaxID=49451 RepID=A0A1J6J2J1_NICAT|nr:hypothetical protein A4A49_08696 [Nicotiana attenuata]
MGHNTPSMTPPFQQMAEFFRQLAGTMSEPSGMNFEKMRKMGGVEFEGTTDPMVVEQWLERVERVFEQQECTNAAKFKYANSLLQKDAYDWWKEFLNLRQGSISIAEYQQNFLRLSRYAGGIIDGERDKCRRFEEGLNGYIRKSVAILQLEYFSKLISVALTWERIDKEEASRRENRRASGACLNCGSMDQKVKDCPNPNPLSYTHTEGSVQKPVTTHSQANSGARPQNMQAAGSSGANKASGSRANARVYAMRQKNDQDGSDVVVGKFHLFGISVVTLFDPGSSHSYVCSSLAFPDNVKSARLDFDVLVTSPLGHQDVVNRIYRDCPFMIQNLVFPADLLEMPFQDYDVIVGMDWLHKHHALVN